MLKNSITRYAIYGMSTVLLSELIFFGFKRVREFMRKRIEISEVIVFNELTVLCPDHLGPSVKYNNHKMRKFIETDPTKKLPPLCKNPFCAVNSIGQLMRLIHNTKYCICLAMYTVSSVELAQALLYAKQRGVVVLVITDPEMSYCNGSQIRHLCQAGMSVRCPVTTKLMHHKFCLFDAPRSVASILKRKGRSNTVTSLPILLTGSVNWTMQGFGGNWENILITSNEKIIVQYEHEFERMWKAMATDFVPAS